MTDDEEEDEKVFYFLYFGLFYSIFCMPVVQVLVGTFA